MIYDIMLYNMAYDIYILNIRPPAALEKGNGDTCGGEHRKNKSPFNARTQERPRQKPTRNAGSRPPPRWPSRCRGAVVIGITIARGPPFWNRRPRATSPPRHSTPKYTPI